MDEPHVYRLNSPRRAALTGVGALMGFGAFELARYVLVYHGSFRGALMVATLLGIGSLYVVLYAWVYRVILAHDAISVVSLNLDFLGTRYGREERSTRRKLYCVDIAGVVRLPSAQNPQVLAFIPRAEGGEAVYVLARRVHTDDYFQRWYDSLPDLDSKDEHVRKYLEADTGEYILEDDAKPAVSASARVLVWTLLVAVVLAPVLVWRRFGVQTSEVRVGLVLGWFVYVAITWFTAWAVTAGLRTGIVGDRSGRQYTRRENPIIFWIALSPAILGLVMELGAGLFVAYQLCKDA